MGLCRRGESLRPVPNTEKRRRGRTDSSPSLYRQIGPGHSPDHRRLLVLRPAFHRSQIATAHQRQRRVLVLLRHDRRSFVRRSWRRQCRRPGQELEGRDGERTCGAWREAQALDGRRAGRGRQGEWADPLFVAVSAVADCWDTVETQNGFDVLNSLTIQDNSLFLEDLKVCAIGPVFLD